MDGRILVKEINDWREFQDIIAEYQNWAFRGQEKSKWPLYSSLSRYFKDYRIHPKAWSEQELRIKRIFERKAYLFLDHVPEQTDAFQWLALMQHHGAPTRLLDFTWSPYVAAFFALERATEDAAVWAVSTQALFKEVFIFHEQNKKMKADSLWLRDPGVYEKYYISNKVPFVTPGDPFVMNNRLIAQSGTFLVPGILDLPIEEILSTYPEPGKMAAKFVLKTRRIRDEAMKALYFMNITNASLFPDLDGLAKSMAYELEFHWAYDPKKFKRYPGYEHWYGFCKIF
jgi:hypothetical protein